MGGVAFGGGSDYGCAETAGEGDNTGVSIYGRYICISGGVGYGSFVGVVESGLFGEFVTFDECYFCGGVS